MIDRSWFARVRELGLRLFFGDRVGLVLFLGTLTLFLTLWRTAFLINDSYTIANGLYAVAHGDISMTVAEHGSLWSPGTNLYDGQAFSRNYGVIVLSLPFLYGFRALAAVADLRIAIIALWSLSLFGTILLTARLLDRRRIGVFGGSVAVVALFALNAALARPLVEVSYYLLALQALHMTVAAFTSVFAYRLLARQYGRRFGVMTALLVVTATPLAFWASVPKRHVVTAAVALGVALSIAYSRADEHPWAFEARALGYVQIALLAWIHAPEALVLFVAFVLVDVPTAPRNDPRTLGLLGLTFLVSLVPLLVTNTLISGSPFTVPRMLDSVSPGVDLSLGGSSNGGSSSGGSSSGGSSNGGSSSGGSSSGGSSSGGSSSGGSSDTGGLLPPFVLLTISLFQSAIEPFVQLLDLLIDGLQSMFVAPDAVYHTLFRSGYVESLARRGKDSAGANLSLLESAPLLASALAALPAFRSRRPRSIYRALGPPDLFLLLFGGMFSLVYISALPVHAQVTVRYLFPLCPIGICLLVRLPTVRDALEVHWRTTLWSGAASVLVGGQLVIVALIALDTGRGEAFQFHALLALALAVVLALWSLVGSIPERGDRIGATLLGLTAGSTSIFLLLVTVEYFGFDGAHALPMMRALADLLPLR
jgi:hypothetical protein